MTTMEERMSRMEAQMEALQGLLTQLAQSQVNLQQQQERTQQQIDQLGQRVDQTNQTVDQMSRRIDAFVYEVQRVLGNQGDRLSRIEAMIESNADAIGRLTRNAEADRTTFRTYTERTDAMVDRLDRLVDYLMRQN